MSQKIIIAVVIIVIIIVIVGLIVAASNFDLVDTLKRLHGG